uniref:Uncharacterized protein LOC100175581 n=1 Tax=Phallusia mammillata TaxID=59560 RepID=A0A6F9DH73_9ASCI|nr:uncharacterized protein LOC100175581 [Phallusia mammillata]
MELAAALDSVQNGLLNLTVKIEAGMMGMAGFPGVHVPPLPGFMPPPNQAPPQQGTSPGFPPESHFSGRGPMGQFAYGAFPGQPNMFYGMGSGTFGNQVPPGAGPTSYSWSSTSNDANGSRQQAQYQAATSKQQQQQPKQQQQQQPPQQQQQQAQPEPPKSSTKEPEPTPAPAPDIRSSISRNQEKLEMLLRMKNLPSTDDS